jgi:uncharacterized Zn finger protein (UPF0148 family)
MTIVAAPSIGTMFGRLEFRGVADGKMTIRGRIIQWLMRCVCGTEKIIPAISVRFGRAKSCGCLRVEMGRNLGLASKGHHRFATHCDVCGAKKVARAQGRLRCEWCRAAKRVENEETPEHRLERKEVARGLARLSRKAFFQKEENRLSRRLYGRGYYRKNKTKTNERQKRYRANRSPEKIAEQKEYLARWYRENEARAYATHIKYHYGITIEEREHLLALQGGHCAICPRKDCDIKGRRLHVDHCHKTNRVRGLLCTRCNLAIGQMEDDPERLRRAADYLESSNA